MLRLGTVRLRHGGPVTGVAFVPGANVLVSGSFDGTIRLWETATGKELRRVAAGQGWIEQIALSPDGKVLASASKDRIVSLWDVATGKEHFRLGPYPSAISSLAFSPDGKTLAGGLMGEKLIRFWNVSSGQELRRLQEEDLVAHVAFAPDSKTLAVGIEAAIRLWDIATGKEVRKLPGSPGGLGALAFAPDGKVLAKAGANDRAVVLYETASGTELGRLSVRRSHEASLFPVPTLLAFSPNGKVLAAGCRSESPADDTVYLWDPATGVELRRIKAASFGVACLAFSADGKTLVSGGNDCAVHLWDTATGDELRPFRAGHHARILAMAYSPDGRALATGGMDGMICLWDLVTGNLRSALDHKAGWVCRLVFSPDGAHSDKSIRLWELATAREVRRLSGYAGGYVSSLAISPDGRTLAATGGAGTILLWETAAGRQLHRMTGQARDAKLAFVPDERTMVSVGEDSQAPASVVRLWDVASGRELRHWLTPQRSVKSLAVSPDGRLLAVAGTEEALRLWEIATGKERPEFQLPAKTSVSEVKFSPDARTLAVACDGGCVSLWEVATGKERRRLDSRQSLSLFCVSFSPDGRTLATAGGDSTVLLWDRSARSVLGDVRRSGSISDEFQRLCVDLGNEDAGLADRAIWALVEAPAAKSVSFLEKHVRPVAEIDPRQVDRLLMDLDSDRFELRDQATRRLEQLGELAEPALRKGLEKRPAPEVRRRIAALLDTLDGPVAIGEHLRMLRATEALEYIGTPQARQLLQQLAKGAPSARLTREAKASLNRLANRQLAP
jgi:WD40 repeat protein